MASVSVPGPISSFATKANAQIAYIHSSTLFIRLEGYTTSGDYGGALYKRVGSAPTHAGKIQSADGAWWEIAETVLRPEMFGAKGDQSVDDQPAIQACVNYHMSFNSAFVAGKGSKILLRGAYKIDAPIECFKKNAGGTGYDFVSVNIEGDKLNYHGLFGPTLYPSYKDRPAIALQANRSSRFANFGVRGPVALVVSSAGDLLTDDNPAANPWWNPNMDLADKSRSPQCGFAVDPFSATMPADGGYPGWNGTPVNNYVGSSGSSNILWENMDVYNFIVGYAWSLSINYQMGDSMRIIGGRLSNCKVGVAIGGDQVRMCSIEQVHSVSTRVFCDCVNYGTGIGVLPVIRSCLIDYCKYAIYCVSTRGAGLIESCFFESTWSIGAWIGNGYPLDIISPSLHAATARDGGPGATGVIDCDFHLFCEATVNVYGGFLGHYTNAITGVILIGPVVLWGTRLGGHVLPSYQNPYPQVSYYGTCNRQGTGPIFQNKHYLIAAYAGNSKASLSPNGGTLSEVGGSFNEKRYWRSFGLDASNYETATVTLGANGSATFTAADAGKYFVGQFLASNTVHNIVFPNRTFYSILGGKLGRVKSIAGSVITLDEVSESIAAGPTNIMEPRVPYFRQRAMGTLTSGSNVITATLPAAANVWAVGDYIRSTSGIPSGARITAIDVAAHTITMSVNATANVTAAPLFDDKLEVSGEISAMPTVEVWWAGDYFKNRTPTVDGNNMVVLGFLCTVSGEPGTWVPVRGSIVSPAV